MSRFSVIFRKFIVFGGGSLLGAIIDYFVTLFLHDTYGLSPAMALVIAMAVSSSVVFIYHDNVTFRGAGNGVLRRYMRFLLLAVLVLCIRVIVLDGSIALGAPVPLAVMIAIITASIINFAASSLFIFLKGRP